MKKIKLSSIMLFTLVFGYCLLTQTVTAREYTHTVVKGDTLWDICEQYYGDATLWPKLWEMNSFITNPHLLNPGDVITLFEEKAEEPEPEEVEETPEPVEEPEPKTMGIGLEGRTNLETLGYFSFEEIPAWGTVFASKDKKIIFQKDDTVYVIFEKGRRVSSGDIFAVGKSSPLIENPSNKKERGYIFNASGILMIENATGYTYQDKKLSKKDNVFQAKILNAYKPIDVNDIVTPYQRVSDCILPVSNSKDILANIIAAKEDQVLIHQYSIAYINKGENDGIRIGNVFNVLKENIVKDPIPGEDKLLFYENILVLPDNIIGKILVIDTKPHTATAIVLSSTRPVSKGAYIKNISWTETPDFLTTLADCPIE